MAVETALVLDIPADVRAEARKGGDDSGSVKKRRRARSRGRGCVPEEGPLNSPALWTRRRERMSATVDPRSVLYQRRNAELLTMVEEYRKLTGHLHRAGVEDPTHFVLATRGARFSRPCNQTNGSS